MDRQRALNLIRVQVDLVPPLEYSKVNPPFDKWHRDTRVVLEKVFGSESRQVREFEDIRFWSAVMSSDDARDQQLKREAFDRGKSEAGSFMQSVIAEVEQFWDESTATGSSAPDPLASVLRLCGRFHQVARQLRSRHDNRSTVEIEDEYDVQNLLHALLRIDFDDIRPEEWTPSYAGRSARMDFLLKDYQIVLEAKKTRKALADKEVGDELLEDMARYKAHPACKTLVCFIYDPEGRIGNPTGLENDLSGERDGLKVVAIVNPK
jgi:hypothetical protein